MSTIQSQPYIVNVGPQHPSTHGVFRMRVTLDGERVIDVEPVMGYLHRSVEKLAEERTYTQCITFTDRMDYLSSMSCNLALVLAAEKLSGVPVPERAQYLRVIFAELQRIASHCMGAGQQITDAGAWQTPLLYMFREREKILDLFEMTCGERLTCNYMRIGGVATDVPEEFLPALRTFVAEMPHHIDEYEELLVDNEIVLARFKGIGILPPDVAINCAVTGPNLRGSGVNWDMRKADPYGIYDRFQFDVPLGEQGDCYDRMMVRLKEMRESVRILDQAMRELPPGEVKTPIPLALRPPPGEAYGHIEGPRGELGFYLVSDGSPAPYRFKVRAPSFINLTALRGMVLGGTLADAIVTTGSIDIVMGEVDR